MSNVLLIGGGGREHAIAWKLSQSTKVANVFVAPGNGGTHHLEKVKNIEISLGNEFSDVITFAKNNQISLVFVGPEQPLVDGITDVCKRHGIPSFGPSSKAAMLESSKAYSKEFMLRHKIPTARHRTFTNYEEALKYVQGINFPVVLKASGLAAGKGVLVPESKEETLEGLKTLMVTKPFGNASDQVVIEERLTGPEVSVLAFTDGFTVSLMPPAQDHKRIGDNDQGLNTGGMGAYAPTPIMNAIQLDEVKRRVIQPAVDGMRREGHPYVGVIYAGVMLTPIGIQTLEFNCRFGDPETQVILPLLESDLFDICQACVGGCLDAIDIQWKASSYSAVTVVMSSKGYPGSYESGKEITGDLNMTKDLVVFHAGTQLKSNKLVTSGGRVLAVTAIREGLKQTVDAAYEKIHKIHFDGCYFRKDIAHKALALNTNKTSATYRDSGVDIDTADALVDQISPLCKATARTGTNAELGGFGGLFDLKATGYKDPILVSGTDGVGTKLLIALAVNKHDTIGIDLVAMSVNDILVQGAEPLFFLDYYATGKLDPHVARDVIAGIARGCKESYCALIGGETAEMPGMYPGGKYDLAGFAVGAVERENLLPKALTPNQDVLLGISSSGIHSNGYSLVRHLIEKNNLTYHDDAPFQPGTKLGEALLTPTKLYVKPCLPLIKKGLIKALAHITGGGLTENLPRVLGDNNAAEIDLTSWEVLPVFKWLAKIGNIKPEEMLRTFNCGIGMVLIVPKEHANEVMTSLKQNGESVYNLGRIIERNGNSHIVYKNELRIDF